MTNASAIGYESRIAGGTLDVQNEASSSGVSWASVAGGAFVSAALSVTLLALGAGLGLSSVSPWTNAGVSASTLGAAGMIWLVAMQIISSSMGGYVAGRLRTKWTQIHTDEVYFRDTAHGFLVWAVGLVITASFLTASAASMAGYEPARAASTASPTADSSSAYYVDLLFRSSAGGQQLAGPTESMAYMAEASRIFVNALTTKAIPAADRAYLGRMIVARTGIAAPEANERISAALLEARSALDTARKNTANALLWTFIALLTGAFCSSYAATIGGRQRDHMTPLAA